MARAGLQYSLRTSGRSGRFCEQSHPVSVHEAGSRAIGALIGVGSEEIALRLGKVLRQLRAAVAVKVRERSRERGNRNSHLHGSCNQLAPGLLRPPHPCHELGVEQQVWEIGWRSNARMIESRKRARIMQPPFQIRAISRKLMSHAHSSDPARIRLMPCA